MRLIPMSAPRFNTFCKGCNKRLFARDSEERVYASPDSPGNIYYCVPCAVLVTEYQDPTRSVNRFYADVDGTSVVL